MAILCGDMMVVGTLGQHLMGTGDPLRNAQIVLETLWASLSEWWRHFGKCPNKRGDLLGVFLTVSLDVLIDCMKSKNPHEKKHPSSRQQ